MWTSEMEAPLVLQQLSCHVVNVEFPQTSMTHTDSSLFIIEPLTHSPRRVIEGVVRRAALARALGVLRRHVGKHANEFR